MRVAYLGNFGAPASTENEVRKALCALGVDVDPLQESEPGVFVCLARTVAEYDLILWTRTLWEPRTPYSEQRQMLDAAGSQGIPTVAYHLDRWWGLGREAEVWDAPFFRCEWVFTADGGHQAEFDTAGVNHHWLPPAVSEFECGGGNVRPEFVSDLAFVGSWRPGYHAEWKHRPELVAFLRRNYPNCNFWPLPDTPAIRGEALRDLYASVKVVIGDSCLAGGATRYWSDRIPETIGRGGFLLHPEVEGLSEHFTDGEHLVTWSAGDWRMLRSLIDHYLADDAERERIAADGRAHVLEHHTYTVRMRQVLAAVGLSVSA